MTDSQESSQLRQFEELLHVVRQDSEAVVSAIRGALFGSEARADDGDEGALLRRYRYALASEKLGYEAIQHALSVALRELIFLGAEVDNLAAAFAGEKLVPRRRDLDLHLLLSETVSLFEARAEVRGIRFELDAPGHAPIRGDEALLRRAFINLLDNAVKYSDAPSDSHPARFIRILSRRHSQFGHMKVTFTSYGAGILAEEIASGQIYEHHQRGSLAENRARGSGIGLAETRRILSDHGGSIDLRSDLMGGASYLTTVTVVLTASGSASGL